MCAVVPLHPGDPSKVYDTYGKYTAKCAKTKEDITNIDGSPADEKTRKAVVKLRENAVKFCASRGPYRMPFAWAAIRLKDPVAYCVGQLKPPVELELFQHQGDKVSDEDMINYLADMCKPREEQTLMKKAKRTPGVFRMRAYGLGAKETIPLCLTSTMYRVKPWDQAPGAAKAQVTLEVQEFPLDKVLEPHRTYRHNLYVYPKGVDMKNTHARNVVCKVEFMDGEATVVRGKPEGHASGSQGQANIYSRAYSVDHAKFQHSVVTYHSKNPDFYDEVKLSLPARLHEKHHLLFTFFHIQCKDSSKSSGAGKDEPAAVGYAWFPLMKQKRIQTGQRIELDIATSLPPGYLSQRSPSSRPLQKSATAPTSKVKWMDGRFTVTVNLDSTVLSDDQYVQGFMLEGKDYLDKAIPSAQGGGNGAEPQLPVLIQDNSAALRNLRNEDVSVQAVVHFLPCLLNQLLDIITHHKVSRIIPSDGPFQLVTEHEIKSKKGDQAATSYTLAKEAFTSLCHIINVVSAKGRKAAGNRSLDLLIYVMHMYHIWGPTGKQENSPKHAGMLFEEIIFWLKQSLAGSKPSVAESKRPEAQMVFKVCIRYAWFFFELTLKSSAQHIHLVSKPRHTSKRVQSRRDQLPAGFFEQVHDVVLDMVASITQHGSAAKNAKQLNADVAFFLRDCMTYYDRTQCFKLIHDVMKLLHQKTIPFENLNNITTEALAQFRVDMLEILTSHEHFVALNLPVAVKLGKSPKKKSSMVPPEVSLDDGFMDNHFLVGLLLHEVEIVLTAEKSAIRIQTITLLRKLLARHDHDERYASKSKPATAAKGASTAVYNLYFPLLPLILNYAPMLQPTSGGADGAFSEDEQRELLVIFLHVITRVKHGMLKLWWKDMVHKEKTKLMDLLARCVEAVSYPGKENLSSMSSTKLSIALGYAEGGTGRASAVATKGKGNLRQMRAAAQAGGAGGLPPLSVDRSSRTSSVSFPTTAADPAANLPARAHSARRRTRSIYAPEARQSRHSMIASQATAPSSHRYVERFCTLCRTHVADLKVWPECERKNAAGHTAKHSLCVECSVRGKKECHLKPSCPVCRDEERKHKEWKQKALASQSVQNSLPSQGEEDLFVLAANLSTEGGLAILDCVESFMDDMKDELQAKVTRESLMHYAFKVIDELMNHEQSARVIQHIVSALETFVHKFRKVIFTGGTQICYKLCTHMFNYCSYNDYDASVCRRKHEYKTRELASAFVYLLMRENYRFGTVDKKSKSKDKDKGPNIARVKMQSTIALSQGLKPETYHYMKRSLGTIVKHSKSDTAGKRSALPTLVQELALNMDTIMFNTIQLEQVKDDFDMMIDLHYRIAEGYKGSPNLRHHWLKTMSAQNEGRKRYAEAAFCHVHCAALMVECMNWSGRDSIGGMPNGAGAFGTFNSNVEEDEAIDSSKGSEEDGLFESPDDKFIEHLMQAARLFESAKMFEFHIAAIKLMVPYYEAKRNSARLQQVHLQISNAYARIIKATPSRTEGCFGAYFRVGFFCKGDLLPARLANKVFISREPPYTSLAAVCDRLKQEIYKSTADTLDGEANDSLVVEVVPHPNKIEVSSLQNESAVYLQVTAVMPYVKERSRLTFFELNVNIKSFVFDTPFTDKGKDHGGIKEQKLRRTYLKTKYAFPYIKSRIEVDERHVKDEVLSPIEIAIERIQQKNGILTDIIGADSVDLKLLHLHFGGCVQAAVNGGPAQYATVFLGDEETRKSIDRKLITKLRMEFGKLVATCGDALKVHATLIETSQKRLHEQFEAGWQSLKTLLDSLKATKDRAGTKSVHLAVDSANSEA